MCFLSLAFVRFERARYALSEYLYREKGLGIWKNVREKERSEAKKQRNRTGLNTVMRDKRNEMRWIGLISAFYKTVYEFVNVISECDM